MCKTADHDHSAPGGQEPSQEVGQEEVTQVVHLKHHLLPVLCHHGRAQEGHTRIVHEDVKLRNALGQLRCKTPAKDWGFNLPDLFM